MKKPNDIYKFIPPDELNYIAGEDHLCLFSEKEYDYIVEHCVLQGFNNREIYSIVSRLQDYKAGALFLKRFLDKKLNISNVDENNELYWSVNYGEEESPKEEH